jgi:hypothetical protein
MASSIVRVRPQGRCEIHLETPCDAVWLVKPTPPRFKGFWYLENMYVCDACVDKYGLMFEVL